jgi:hypothetical protein
MKSLKNECHEILDEFEIKFNELAFQNKILRNEKEALIYKKHLKSKNLLYYFISWLSDF